MKTILNINKRLILEDVSELSNMDGFALAKDEKGALSLAKMWHNIDPTAQAKDIQTDALNKHNTGLATNSPEGQALTTKHGLIGGYKARLDSGLDSPKEFSNPGLNQIQDHHRLSINDYADAEKHLRSLPQGEQDIINNDIRQGNQNLYSIPFTNEPLSNAFSNQYTDLSLKLKK